MLQMEVWSHSKRFTSWANGLRKAKMTSTSVASDATRPSKGQNLTPFQLTWRASAVIQRLLSKVGDSRPRRKKDKIEEAYQATVREAVLRHYCHHWERHRLWNQDEVEVRDLRRSLSLRSSKFQSLETNLELSKSRVMTGPRKDLLHHISMMKLVLETWEKGPVPLLWSPGQGLHQKVEAELVQLWLRDLEMQCWRQQLRLLRQPVLQFEIWVDRTNLLRNGWICQLYQNLTKNPGLNQWALFHLELKETDRHHMNYQSRGVRTIEERKPSGDDRVDYGDEDDRGSQDARRRFRFEYCSSSSELNTFDCNYGMMDAVWATVDSGAV